MDVKFTVTITLNDDGEVDKEGIMGNLNYLLDFGVREGSITPDDDDHASFKSFAIAISE